MEDTPEYDFLPQLVPCPVCKGLNGEDATICAHCHTEVKAHLERIKAEEDARREREDAARAKQAEREATMKVILYGGGGVLLLYILHLISPIK